MFNAAAWCQLPTVLRAYRTLGSAGKGAVACAMATQAAAEPVKVNVSDSSTATLTLDRGKGLNACDYRMVVDIGNAVRRLKQPQECARMVITSSSPKAFCAGGDVKALREATLAHPVTEAQPTFPADHPAVNIFQAEYSLACNLACLAQPVVALCDGICMGFGVGLASRADFRVVTEHTVMAMPENNIGLFPDVGFAHFAANTLDWKLGLFIALTGQRVSNPGDLVRLGFATHYIPREKLPQALSELQALPRSDTRDAREAVAEALQSLSADLPPADEGELLTNAAHIQRVVEAATRCLAAPGGNGTAAAVELMEFVRDQVDSAPAGSQPMEFYSRTLSQLQSASPRSVALTLQHFWIVKQHMDSSGPLHKLQGCMEQELNIAVRMSCQHDFTEGVRAALVDKTKDSKWMHSAVGDVPQSAVDALFEPIGPTVESWR